MSQPIRLVLADDHTLFRQGLRQVLELCSEFTVVGEAATGDEAVALATTVNPDVVIMDVSMPGGGLRAVEQVRERCPEVGILVLTMHEDQEYLLEALRVGAHGYLVKDVDSTVLMEAIRSAQEGRPYIHPKLAGLTLIELTGRGQGRGGRSREVSALTERELQVLRLVGQGSTNREISETLFITEKTTKNHLTRIFEKLGVGDRTQAALVAIKEGLVGINERAEH